MFTTIFDEPKTTLPPKTREILDFGWVFPLDFPVVSDNHSPDATRTLKAVIQNSLQNYYYDHRISHYDVSDFNRHLQNRLYNEMAQHQYWINEYLGLIDDNQFFYNDEWQTFARAGSGTSNGTSTSLTKTSDTPQNQISDINQYLTSAGQDSGSDSNTSSQTQTEDNHIKKSTLGDITVQFRNFAEFPNFIEKLIQAVKPCFNHAYVEEYDDDQEYVGYRFERHDNPSRTDVYDVMDNYIATLTDGARTVALQGAQRTFVETSQGVNDSFNRIVAGGFGRSTVGGKYFITESYDADFSVDGTYGKMVCSTVNTSRRATLTQTNAHKSFSGQVKIKSDKDAVGAGQDSGITFGYVDLLNHYEGVLRFSSAGTVQVGLIKKVDGASVTIGSFVQVAPTRTLSDTWNVKVDWNGTTGQLKVKAWVVGTAEPGWQVEQTDNTYTSGRVGLRAIINSGTTNAPVTFSFSNFVGNGDWVSNPTVTHKTYVRFLPTPFSGTPSKEDVKWLKSALKDTTNDLLAEAMRYTAQGDLNTHYGALTVTGSRPAGADWNDYLGITATYPNTGEPDDPAEPEEYQAMDCSGFVRMILRTFNFPLSRYVLSPSLIPRESKDISDQSAGVIVIPRVTNQRVTEYDKLQIGDLLGFDADLDDPEEGQIDHVGFYFGKDQFGKRRFISSRSTPDGVTFADLGGQSVIDGTTNLYSRSFRTSRRV